MRGFFVAVLAFASAVLIAPSIAAPSTLVLKNGGRLSGEITQLPQRSKKFYEIRTSAGAVLTVAEDQVLEVLDPKNLLPEYEKHLPNMPATAEGNWMMAKWCAREELKEEQIHHLRKVIELEPNHAEARDALGYKQVNGGWENPDEQWRALGYRKVGSKYMTEQQIELEEAADRLESKRKEYLDQIRKLHVKALRSNDEQALAQLREIKDPVAIDAMVTLYLTTRQGQVQGNYPPTPELKKVYMNVVARNPTYSGVQALVHLALNDPNENLRDYSVQQLIEAKHPATTSLLLAKIRDGIKDGNGDAVNNAAIALQRLNAEEAVFPLIAALTMKIRTRVGGNSGNGIGATPMFDGGGGAGISAGGKEKIIEETRSNPGVLSALRGLTRQNFDYDQAAWKRWYVLQKTPVAMSLRRDE
jgi:hypothetical protein